MSKLNVSNPWEGIFTYIGTYIALWLFLDVLSSIGIGHGAGIGSAAFSFLVALTVFKLEVDK